MAYRPPAPVQNFAQTAVRIQRFRYEKMAGLQLRGEEQPCWIFYRNPVLGMLLSVGVSRKRSQRSQRSQKK